MEVDVEVKNDCDSLGSTEEIILSLASGTDNNNFPASHHQPINKSNTFDLIHSSNNGKTQKIQGT